MGDAGETDSIFTYSVVSGADSTVAGPTGQGIDHINLTSGSESAGSTATYTIWGRMLAKQ